LTYAVVDGQLGSVSVDRGGLNAACNASLGFRCGTHDSVPLIIYDPTSLAMILAPQDNFKDVTVGRSAQGELTFGWQGALQSVPAGSNYSVLLVASHRGVRYATTAWGAALRAQYRRNATVTEQDVTLSHLTYATDNGAIAYYQTETGRGPQADWNKTFYDAQMEALSKGVRYGSYQLDRSVVCETGPRWARHGARRSTSDPTPLRMAANPAFPPRPS
jgi:hypothetical protein